MIERGEIRLLPLYLDSPMASKASDVYRRHPEFYDEETANILQAGGSPLDYPKQTITHDVKESRAIAQAPRPYMIVASNGMLTGGRVVGHLRNLIGDPGARLLFVGYQGQGTLGAHVQRGARNRRTPYHEATQRYGPQGFTVYNHMYFPIRFDTFEAEFDALLNGVTIWDVSVERCLEISGPDGFRFAQLLTPRDLSKCAVGQAKYVLICDSDGGIVNDPVLTRMDDNTFWFALASSDALLFARALRNAYPDLDVTITEADVAPLQVQGPKSKDLIRDLVGDSISDLKYYWWRRAEIRGIPVVVTRTGWTSEVGYELYLLDSSRGSDLWEAPMEAGAPYGVKPTGPADTRRLEGGT